MNNRLALICVLGVLALTVGVAWAAFGVECPPYPQDWTLKSLITSDAWGWQLEVYMDREAWVSVVDVNGDGQLTALPWHGPRGVWDPRIDGSNLR